MELRVPQVRRLPVCISRVDTTHKCLSHREALGAPRPLIFERVLCATHAHSPSARSIRFVSFGFEFLRGVSQETSLALAVGVVGTMTMRPQRAKLNCGAYPRDLRAKIDCVRYCNLLLSHNAHHAECNECNIRIRIRTRIRVRRNKIPKPHLN
jgi:hypothetical protein